MKTVKRKLRGRHVIEVDAQIIRWRKSRKQHSELPARRALKEKKMKTINAKKNKPASVVLKNMFCDEEDDT